MTHFVSTFQAAPLRLCIVLLLNILYHYFAVKHRLLLPEPSKPRPSVTQHVANRHRRLILLAKKRVINTVKRKKSHVWLSRFRWGRLLARAVPLLLSAPTSARCWWSGRALIDDCIHDGALGFLYSMWVSAEWKLISCKDTRVMNTEVFSFFSKKNKKIPRRDSFFFSSHLCIAHFLLIMDPAASPCFNHHFYLSFRRVSNRGLVSRGF